MTRTRRRDEAPAALSFAWWSRIGERFRECERLELEQNVIRLGAISGLLLYGVAYALLTGENIALYVFILSSQIALGILVFVWLYFSPQRSPARILVVTAADRLGVAWLMATHGLWTAFAFFFFPWTDIANSGRYGRRYLLPSVALSLLGFGMVVYGNEIWRTPTTLPFTAGVLLCIITSPLYSNVFHRRLDETAAKLKELATHDSLTRLPNRPFFYDRLNQAIAGAERHRRQFAVLFIDLDNFKRINDSGGHEAGDRALCEAAQALRQAVRQGDTVARLGGDEFIVLMDDLPARSTATLRSVADNVREALAAHTQNRLCASIGVAAFPRCGVSAETLIQHADRAMYAAKKAGKNQSCLCAELQDPVVADSADLEHGETS